jgi:carbonic anhydrase
VTDPAPAAQTFVLTKMRRDQLTPDDIIAAMKKGNERFRLGQESPHDYLAQQKVRPRPPRPVARRRASE